MRKYTPTLKRKKPPPALAVKRKARKTRPSAGVRLTRPMRSLVDARVNQHLETRTVKASLWPQASGTSMNFANHIDDMSVATIIPRIRQAQTTAALGEADVPYRVGNEICPKYCSVRIRLWVNPNDTVVGASAGDRCMIQPYLFVGTHRARKQYDVLTQNNWDCLQDFWRGNQTFATTDDPALNGMGEATMFTGERGDFTQGTLNRDKFSPVKGGVKTFALCRPLGWQLPTMGAAASGGLTIPYVGREFNFKIPMPQKLKYTDNNSEYPANYCPFVAVGFTYMNGAPASLEKPLLAESQVTFVYTDA